MEVFSEGVDFEEIFEKMDEEKLAPYIESKDTFKINVKSF